MKTTTPQGRQTSVERGVCRESRRQRPERPRPRQPQKGNITSGSANNGRDASVGFAAVGFDLRRAFILCCFCLVKVSFISVVDGYEGAGQESEKVIGCSRMHCARVNCFKTPCSNPEYWEKVNPPKLLARSIWGLWCALQSTSAASAYRAAMPPIT